MVAVLVALTLSTTWLAGMIWTVQVVHYPLFALVGSDGFAAYESAHAARIAALLLGPWAVQGLTTAVTLLSPPAGVPRWMVLAAAALAASTVLVTVTLSVPAHQVLADGFEAGAHARLVATNWLRTLAWTAHAGLAAWMLVLHLRSAPAA